MFELMIAADNPAGCQRLQTLVKEHFGELFHVLKTVSEQTLLQEIISERPDVILFDIDQPKLSLLKIAAQMKGFLPQCRLIIISNFDDFSYTRAALSLGADEYIDKPIRLPR